MDFSGSLRSHITKTTLAYINAQDINRDSYRVAQSAVIFDLSGDVTNNNFLSRTYGNIFTNPNYAKRLDKRHASFSDSTSELQSSNSSDALLMNIFCHPDFFSWEGPKKLLKLTSNRPEFGWCPRLAVEAAATHQTEIDMKIGDCIFEAKLTESDFTSTTTDHLLSTYAGISSFLDIPALSIGGETRNYQLLRNIYVAYKQDLSFTLLVDIRRPDLIRDYFEVVTAISQKSLRDRCRFVTWQEITDSVGKELKDFLNIKYGMLEMYS